MRGNRANALLALGLLLTAAVPAQAQYARAQATYRSSELEVRVVVLDVAGGDAAASATVTQGACSASVAGQGQLRKRTLVLTPHVKQPGSESCRVVLSFDDRWTRVTARSEGDCSGYGGAACEWAGQGAARTAD